MYNAYIALHSQNHLTPLVFTVFIITIYSFGSVLHAITEQELYLVCLCYFHRVIYESAASGLHRHCHVTHAHWNFRLRHWGGGLKLLHFLLCSVPQAAILFYTSLLYHIL